METKSSVLDTHCNDFNAQNNIPEWMNYHMYVVRDSQQGMRLNGAISEGNQKISKNPYTIAFELLVIHRYWAY